MISPELEAEIRRLFFAEHWKRGIIATFWARSDAADMRWLMSSRDPPAEPEARSPRRT